MNFPVLSNFRTRASPLRPGRMSLDDEEVSVSRDGDVIRLIQLARPGGLVPLAGLALRAQREQHLSLRVQLVDHVRADIGCPDIAVAIETHAVGSRKQSVAEGADERAVLVEFEEGLGSPRQHQQVAFRVERHAGGGAHRDSGGNGDRVWHRHVAQFRGRLRHEQRRIRRALREGGSADQEHRDSGGGCLHSRLSLGGLAAEVYSQDGRGWSIVTLLLTAERTFTS